MKKQTKGLKNKRNEKTKEMKKKKNQTFVSCVPSF
jgi:hypothetical protein